MFLIIRSDSDAKVTKPWGELFSAATEKKSVGATFLPEKFEKKAKKKLRKRKEETIKRIRGLKIIKKPKKDASRHRWFDPQCDSFAAHTDKNLWV